MKLIIAIIRDMDNDKVSHALTDANFQSNLCCFYRWFFCAEDRVL